MPILIQLKSGFMKELQIYVLILIDEELLKNGFIKYGQTLMNT